MGRMFDYNLTAGTKTIAASDTFTTGALDISQGENYAVNVVAVSGTAPDFSISYTASTESDGTYITPDSPTIAANVGAAKSVGFTPVLSKFIKITFTNNNASNSVIVTAKLTVQEGC